MNAPERTGKPAGRRGRNASGPDRAAELPNKVDDLPFGFFASANAPCDRRKRLKMTRVRKADRLATILAIIAAFATGLAGSASALSGTIAGTVFQDENRNGLQDAGEAPWEGHQVYLFDGSGTYRGNASSDAS